MLLSSAASPPVRNREICSFPLLIGTVVTFRLYVFRRFETLSVLCNTLSMCRGGLACHAGTGSSTSTRFRSHTAAQGFDRIAGSSRLQRRDPRDRRKPQRLAVPFGKLGRLDAAWAWLPGARASVVCLDDSALQSCRRIRLPPGASVRMACLDGGDYEVPLHAMVRNVTGMYRTHGNAARRAKARAYYFKRDLYTALTWAKAAIVHAATSSGFGVVYSDSDIIYHNRMRPRPGVLAMMRGNSGYVVAPPHSRVVAEWFFAGFTERWTAKEGTNCCDQVALEHAVEEAHGRCENSTRYPNCRVNGSERAHIHEWFYIPQCGRRGGRFHAIGTHYNCFGDNLVNGSKRERKRLAMQRNGQWHAVGGAESDCQALDGASICIDPAARAGLHPTAREGLLPACSHARASTTPSPIATCTSVGIEREVGGSPRRRGYGARACSRLGLLAPPNMGS